MDWPDDYINKIINGDCLEVMKQIPDKSIDLVLTDPPYGMDYVSSWRKHRFAKIELDKNVDWFEEFITEAYRVLKDDTHIYVFCNDFAISDFRALMDKVGFTPKRTLVWVKNNHTSGDLEGDYGNKTEFILYAQKGRKELTGKRDTNVLKFDRVSILKHPTEKPLQLCQYLIQKSSNIGDIVFDPFAGSGTTTRAAMDLHRSFIGIEISPEYCKIAEDRLRQQVLNF